MKLNAVILSARNLSKNVSQLTNHNATYCTVRMLTTSLDAANDYDNAKPFNSIPGPAGLPYFGTLFYYRAGKLSV